MGENHLQLLELLLKFSNSLPTMKNKHPPPSISQFIN